MDPDAASPGSEPKPPLINYVLSFLLVGVAWGFTTPFIRRAAADFNSRQESRRKQQNSHAHARGQGQRGEPARGDGVEGEGEGEEGTELVDRGEEDDDDDDDDGDKKSGSTNEDDMHSDTDTNNQAQSTPVWAQPQSQAHPSKLTWLKNKLSSLIWTIVNLLRTPAYLVPLVINLTGSVWFFLLVGKHELSLTVPLANSSAFLFTVLGEWYVERKVIAKETWLGMVLVLIGIGICVQAKN